MKYFGKKKKNDVPDIKKDDNVSLPVEPLTENDKEGVNELNISNQKDNSSNTEYDNKTENAAESGENDSQKVINCKNEDINDSMNSVKEFNLSNDGDKMGKEDSYETSLLGSDIELMEISAEPVNNQISDDINESITNKSKLDFDDSLDTSDLNRHVTFAEFKKLEVTIMAISKDVQIMKEQIDLLLLIIDKDKSKNEYESIKVKLNEICNNIDETRNIHFNSQQVINQIASELFNLSKVILGVYGVEQNNQSDSTDSSSVQNHDLENKTPKYHDVVLFTDDDGIKFRINNENASPVFYIRELSGEYSLEINEGIFHTANTELIEKCFDIDGLRTGKYANMQSGECIFDNINNTWLLKTKGRVKSVNA